MSKETEKESVSRLCRHRIYTETGTTRGCRLKTKNPSGFCHIHACVQPDSKFLEERPENCPVCMEKIKSNVRALSCGHYCHLSCILKTDTVNCPICRAELPEIIDLVFGNTCECCRHGNAHNGGIIHVELMGDAPPGEEPLVRIIFELPAEFIASIAITYRLRATGTLSEFIRDSIASGVIRLELLNVVSPDQRESIINMIEALAQNALDNPEQWF